MRATRAPLSNVALACLARRQLSTLARAMRSSSAFFFAASAASACFFLASSDLSTPVSLGAGAGAAVLAAESVASGVAGPAPGRAFENIFLGYLRAWPSIAKDFSPVFVNPLPLGARPHGQGEQEYCYEGVQQFHGCSLASGRLKAVMHAGTIRFLEL